VPYSIDYKNKCVHKKVTKIKNGKKVTMRGEKVGCTKGSLDDYIAALQIHAENKKTMKKTVKEQDELQKPIDGSLNQVFAVQKPYAGCELTSLVKPIDPLLGLAGHKLVPDQIHAIFADDPIAQKIATEIYEVYLEKEVALEEKKEVTTTKLKSAIDAIEKKRKEHMDMAKEDPKNASKHREQIALITSKLDDLMTKLEKIEKSKKPIEEKLKNKK